MASGGTRASTGPIPKLNPDGTRVNPKRPKLAPGEVPRPRGRPPKLNPDGTRANPAPRRAAKAPKTKPEAQAAEVAGALPADQARQDFSHLPFPEVGLEGMPLDLLLGVMRDKRMHPELRMRAAQVALPFTAIKPGEVKPGKREQQQIDAQALAAGGSKFSSGRAPLTVVTK